MVGKTTRRQFLSAAAVATSGAVLAACQPKIVEVEKIVKETVMVEGTPQVIEKVVKETVVQKEVVKETVIQVESKTHIAWFDWGDINDKQIADNTIADFHEEHPEIEVELQGSAGSYYDKLQTVLAAGVAPDLIMYQGWRWQPYALRGVMLELAELRERDDWNKPYQTGWESLWIPQTIYRGKLYGHPWNVAPMVMFYIKKPFDDAGIPYPNNDWTYDEFVETCKKLTFEKDGAKHYGYQTNVSYERLACWMRMNGEKEWDTENEPKKATWDMPTVMESLQWQCNECINGIQVSPTPDEIAGGAALQNGNVAMKMEGAWFLPNMQGPKAAVEGGTPFDVVMMPKGMQGEPRHMGFGCIMSINSQTKHVDEAWTFLKYTGDEKAQNYVAQGGRQPCTPEYMDKYWVPAAHDVYKFENTEAFVRCLDTGVIHLMGMNDLPLTREILQPAFDAMVAGQSTAQELFPELNQQIQEMVDAYWTESGS